MEASYKCPRCNNQMPLNNKILHDLKCNEQHPVQLDKANPKEILNQNKINGHVKKSKSLSMKSNVNLNRKYNLRNSNINSNNNHIGYNIPHNPDVKISKKQNNDGTTTETKTEVNKDGIQETTIIRYDKDHNQISKKVFKININENNRNQLSNMNNRLNNYLYNNRRTMNMNNNMFNMGMNNHLSNIQMNNMNINRINNNPMNYNQRSMPPYFNNMYNYPHYPMQMGNMNMNNMNRGFMPMNMYMNNNMMNRPMNNNMMNMSMNMNMNNNMMNMPMNRPMNNNMMNMPINMNMNNNMNNNMMNMQMNMHMNNNMMIRPMNNNMMNMPMQNNMMFMPMMNMPIPMMPPAPYNGLDPNLLNNLPETKIKDVENLDPEKKECVICLEEFKNDDLITSLPCIHSFHTHCIKSWLQRVNECPVCKFQITYQRKQFRSSPETQNVFPRSESHQQHR